MLPAYLTLIFFFKINKIQTFLSVLQPTALGYFSCKSWEKHKAQHKTEHTASACSSSNWATNEDASAQKKLCNEKCLHPFLVKYPSLKSSMGIKTRALPLQTLRWPKKQVQTRERLSVAPEKTTLWFLGLGSWEPGLREGLCRGSWFVVFMCRTRSRWKFTTHQPTHWSKAVASPRLLIRERKLNAAALSCFPVGWVNIDSTF